MQSNLAIAKKYAPHAKACAVVKANAYGHGLKYGMLGFAEADALGLIELEAAAQLRDLGWQKPIILLEGFFEPSDVQLAIQRNFEPVIHCTEQIEMLESTRLESPMKVHLKMNSGMNRLGFKPENFRAAHARLKKIAGIKEIGLMTHFANADERQHPVMPVDEQLNRFQFASRGLPGERSLCNSAAGLMHPEIAGDWIRPGIILYGGSPDGSSVKKFGLRSAMTLTSKLIGIQEICKGESVGYGSLFVADSSMKVGIVACGYADGYPRHAPTGTPILVNGVRTRVVGRVSMDMMAVDLSPLPVAQVDSPVTLWGDALPIDEVAQAAGTIGYELMCALAQRVRVEVRTESDGPAQAE